MSSACYTANQLRSIARLLDGLEQHDSSVTGVEPMAFRVELKDNDGVEFGVLRCPDGLWVWEPDPTGEGDG